VNPPENSKTLFKTTRAINLKHNTPEILTYDRVRPVLYQTLFTRCNCRGRKIIEPLFPIILGLSLAAVHFLGEELEKYFSSYRQEILSFSTGASITYIFVQLLPEFHNIALESTELIFIFPLIGFSGIHLTEKYIAKSSLSPDKMKKDYAELHAGFLVFYHAAIGYLVASLIVESTVSGILFFLPILLHTAVSSLSTTELHEDFARKQTVKTVLVMAPLFGVLAHLSGIISEHLFNPIFGTAIGMFFYVVIRDSIPEGKKGRPLEYLIGSATYLTVIFIANTL
jgi:hypothetical protein